MSQQSPTSHRKRPRRDPPPSYPPPSPPPQPPGPSDEEDDAAFAFYSALSADLADGKTIFQAVESLFDTITDEVSTPNRRKLQALNLAQPIIIALRSSPALASNLRTVARMCQTVYYCAEGEIDILRTPRARLQLTLSHLSDVATIIDNARNIVVLTGAGVSVSCGIPDFRSKGGLYDTVLERYGLEDPQAIFDLEEFKMDPALFYSFAKDVMPSSDVRPSATHRFVADLERRGKLLRNYSQNIDGLESRAGVSEERLVLCHGSFLTATCMRRSCRASISGDDIAADVATGTVPICKKCGDQGPVDADDDDDDGGPPDAEAMGVVKPDVVFFGESLPKKVGDSLQHDVSRADLLLVLGTSLQVAPVAKIPQHFKDNVPRILVNRELVYYDFDVELLGNCDAVIHELRKALDWASDEASPSCKKDEPSMPESGNTSVKPATEDNGSTNIAETSDNAPAVVFRPPRRFIFNGASRIDTKPGVGAGGSGDSDAPGETPSSHASDVKMISNDYKGLIDEPSREEVSS